MIVKNWSMPLIKDLFESAPKSMSTNIYIHNFSHFDSVFILRTLAEYSSTFSIILSFLATPQKSIFIIPFLSKAAKREKVGVGVIKF